MMWKYIDDTWTGPKRNNIHGRRALKNKGTLAYCRHCFEEIRYRGTGYISWPTYDDKGKMDSISSGTIYLTELCEHCGQLNDPYDKVYIYAKDSKGKDLEQYILASSFFEKQWFDELKKEYEREGELIFYKGEK